MRFVEQKDELRLVEVADFGKPVEQLGQQPKQERRVEARRIHQLLGGENIDDAAAVGRELQEIDDVERRLAEEFVGALLFEHEQAALDDADRRRGDVSVLAAQRRGALAHFVDDGAQILEIEDRHFLVAGFALVCGPAEGDVQHAFLRFGQLHQARKQERSHLFDRGTNGVPIGAEDIPEDRREGRIAVALQADLFGTLDKLRRRLALGGDA